MASAGRWHKKGDFGNGVILWNPHTGTQIRDFRTTANGGTRSVAFSPDGKRLAIGTQRFGQDTSTGGVRLVHVSTGNVDWLQTVPGRAKPVAFPPDGKSVVARCGRRSVRFLETGTGTVKHEIRAAGSPEDERWYDFAITPQGDRLAVGGIDAENRSFVEVWSLGGGEDDAELRPGRDGR